MNLRSGRDGVAGGAVHLEVDGGTGLLSKAPARQAGTGASTGIGAGTRSVSGNAGKIAGGTGGVVAVPPLEFSQKALAQATVASICRACQHLGLPVYLHA
jgi:hypothetical protein